MLQLRQATASTAQSSHPQVNNTDGLYFPAVTAGTTLYNYTLSTDNNTITFNSALPQNAVVFCERRTRDDDGTYTSFATGSTIRATDLNNSATESNFTAQDGRNKALTIEGVLFRGDQPSTNFITTDHIVAGTIVNNDIQNDAVNGDKIAANSIDSEHYVNLSIDREHLSENIIDSGKLASDSVDSRHYVNGSIDLIHMSDNSVDSDQYVDGSIDHVHLANDCVDEDNIQNDSIRAEHIKENEVTDSEILTGTLDNRYYTETELSPTASAGANVLDARYYTETEAEALFLRQDSSETVSSGQTWDNTDSKVATTAAIDLRIIELVDNVGGFVPIANETSFPTENPDINNANNKKGGTIVSVNAASTALPNGSNATLNGTTLTISNGRGTGNAVIITGVTATIPQGFGFLVETTATDHTYAFHRLLPVATQVATVANNITNIVNAGANVADINNFADLYQISTSAPTGRADGTSLQNGDLWFDSSSNKVMMVYDGSAGDGFTAITPNAATLTNINIVAGHVTFQEDLGNITDAINSGSGNNAINTVGASIANVNTVANDLNETTSEIDTVATNITNVNNVGNSITNVNTVATNISSVNTVANSTNLANITAVAADATDIGAVAGKATEIGRLGTADAVADLAILGTTDVVADLNTLATSAIVSDMDTLADISSNITTVANISANVTAVAGNATNINAVQGNATNINAVAGNNSNITAVANNSSNINSAVSNASNINSAVSNATNINTVASSIADVNRYAAEYVIQSGTPSSPSAGDLWYNTTSNVLNYYTGSTFVGISPGIAGLINDANPALANHLDCNDKNLTEVGTVSGNNLQLDFGTI